MCYHDHTDGEDFAAAAAQTVDCDNLKQNETKSACAESTKGGN